MNNKSDQLRGEAARLRESTAPGADRTFLNKVVHGEIDPLDAELRIDKISKNLQSRPNITTEQDAAVVLVMGVAILGVMTYQGLSTLWQKYKGDNPP